MSTNTKFSVYARRVVDLHIPRDKECDRPKGYAFAEYETEEIAEYAVRLFSGLVTLQSNTQISGQDKPSPNVTSTVMPTTNFSNKLRSLPVPINNVENLQNSMSLSAPCKILAYAETYPSGCGDH
ncbi:putative nucleotide-binding alpha-beta plait domain-containing protein [Rosa chinensis]|uniref:Putative nucleotide-binding alpha-beta plait domain-containing protein n=1 Tax=Rosa chinensis TaxID=74649 RepID=A0A2P6PT61_ROSCH|nr:putative nucleotide-binding alpha-beta plait domain-containing protein [Rosa chinensis]